MDVEALAQRRDGGQDDPLAEILVVDIGNIVGDEAIFAAGGVAVFAAQLDVQDRAGVLVRFGQLPVVGQTCLA